MAVVKGLNEECFFTFRNVHSEVFLNCFIALYILIYIEVELNFKTDVLHVLYPL